MWRFPLLLTANAPTFDSRQLPQELLRAQPPPLPEKILNVCDIKTKPELTRYYHAAVGFPAKLTWLAAIKNGHYKTWPGLDGTMTVKYFPESKEMWWGHGRKIKPDLRSTAGPGGGGGPTRVRG